MSIIPDRATTNYLISVGNVLCLLTQCEIYIRKCVAHICNFVHSDVYTSSDCSELDSLMCDFCREISLQSLFSINIYAYRLVLL